MRVMTHHNEHTATSPWRIHTCAMTHQHTMDPNVCYDRAQWARSHHDYSRASKTSECNWRAACHRASCCCSGPGWHDVFIWDMTSSYGTWLVISHMQERASATDEARMIVRVAAARALADMTCSYGTSLVVCCKNAAKISECSRRVGAMRNESCPLRTSHVSKGPSSSNSHLTWLLRNGHHLLCGAMRLGTRWGRLTLGPVDPPQTGPKRVPKSK